MQTEKVSLEFCMALGSSMCCVNEGRDGEEMSWVEHTDVPEAHEED